MKKAPKHNSECPPPADPPLVISKVKFMSKNDVVLYEFERCKDEEAIVCSTDKNFEF